MSLRLKLSLMLSLFLILLFALASGTIIIFDMMSESLTPLRSVGEESKQYNELARTIGDMMVAAKDWGLSGNPYYRKEFRQKLREAYKGFGDMNAQEKQKPEFAVIGKKFHRIVEISQVIVNTSSPEEDPSVARNMKALDELGIDLITHVDELQAQSVGRVLDVIIAGEAARKNLLSYHVVLIVCSSLLALFLIVSIRRTITIPFNELLKATGMISRGEFSYRIRMKRSDEFGIIAERFDHMVSALEETNRKVQYKLGETELFLDVTSIAGTTLELRESLSLMTRTIATKLHYDNCAIYMLRPETRQFCLEAQTHAAEGPDEPCAEFDAALARKIVSSLSHVSVADTQAEGASFAGAGAYRSFIAVPIIRENACAGVLAVMNREPAAFADDEVKTLQILAQTIGAVVRNAELFQSTRKQLNKLSILYELSKAVTSVLSLSELLQKIAAEISRLLSSQGCIIRLLENNRLKVRASYGLPAGVEDKMELSLGEGLAGWVAANGRPMLVEDMEKMPPEMRVPVIDVTSVICVPLKVGEEVIGTLGLYNKQDSGGEVASYTADDLGTAEGFAYISSIAIEQSKIYENEVIRERRASEDKKRLDILFDSVQGGIITLDRDFVITSVNKYVQDWIGMPAEELLGKNSIEVFHDKVGICPHCAAKATVDTGEINSIMQTRGVNYAELTAYPIKDDKGRTVEAVVFIMDITERVLYQEETLSLYREVIQTKDYLESIISHSADAIVTTDLNGIITSWNEGAEKTFGFTEPEAIGTFLPFVPDFLVAKEKEHLDRIRKGEVLKDVESLRKKKDGTIIEVSLALSPIKDASGAVIGISGISRDISDKKRVEKELIRRNQELSRLFFISSAMRGTLELDKLLRMVLTAVTMSDGLGFNRAILFLVDEEVNVLKGAMGVGPSSTEEAWKIWDELSSKQRTLNDIMQEIMTDPARKDMFLDRLTLGIEIPLTDDSVLTRAVREKRPFHVPDVKEEASTDAIIIQQLGTQAYAVVPLVSRDRVLGLIWVDNFFNRKPITDEDMQFLQSFSNHVASAIENARLFEKVSMAEQQLENIFESISDMVYFVSKEYVIKSVNKAVGRRLGLEQSELIGKRCYEVFHGMNEPFRKCPHHKTVLTKQSYIEEYEDPHMGGTFLASSSPIFDITGEFIGSVHVVRDVTELQHLREKLITAEKMAALGEVAAKVAHEIRNPLVSVGGFAKRLEKKLYGNLKEYAEIIVREVERLEHILREILGFVKEARLAREKTDLAALAEEVVKLMQSDMEDRGINLVREYGEPLEVFIDPHRVKEAIVNILTNAIQSLVGSGSIHIRTYASGSSAVIEIEDTGKGIPEDEMPNIFNPFYTTKSSGTGLGLAITNRIVQEHNGRIEVDSAVDRGTVFRVFIPMKEEPA